MEYFKHQRAARIRLHRVNSIDCIRLTSGTHPSSLIPSRDLSVRGLNLSRLRPIITVSDARSDRFPRGSNLQKQRGHRARDRGSGAIFNSASGQWLESAREGDAERKRDREKETTTTKEDVEIEKDKKKRDREGRREGGQAEKGEEGEVIRGCSSGARKCPRPRGEKRVRVSLNNFDHTSRQSDTRAYEYIHLNAPRRPGKYCPNF